MKIAVEGCAHGELDKIYETLQALEKKNNFKVDLLLICGDFQSVRNPADLQCMAVPPKYRTMNTFYKYYSGEKVAPVLTIFIGGNHEASNYLSELPYGGWVCPNIYYMGYANVINVGGIRIAGLSGIYKARDYLRGHFERPPYDKSTIKSAYHVRNLDVFRLKQVQNPIDICLSHDWPTGVYHYGNKQELLRYKPFFRDEMTTNKLGSQPAEELLEKLKPSYWFSAHLHCKFSAIVPHDDKGRPETKFLALDKCLPRRNFLQVLDIVKKSDTVQIEYDPEWLSILRSTNHLFSSSRRNIYMPGPGSNERWDFRPDDEEMRFVKNLFENDLKVPDNFSVTAPTYNPGHKLADIDSSTVYINSQTKLFCNVLNITDPQALVLNDSVSISDFSCTGSDVTYSSVITDDNMSMEDIDKSQSETSTKDTDSSFSCDFFIDKGRSRQDVLDSNDFVIDKKGSHGEVTESDDFFIDKIGSHDFAIDKNSSTDFFIDREGAGEFDLNRKDSNDFVVDSKGSLPLNARGLKRGFDQMGSRHVRLFCSDSAIKNKAVHLFPEFQKENVNCFPNESPLPPGKKFKRRNYDLYKPSSDVST